MKKLESLRGCAAGVTSALFAESADDGSSLTSAAG
jgi:hypothetical protein